jgi:HAD superfamily hydrolase (TIGR01509 family)
MTIKALLLDCDGVVVDSERLNFLCWENALGQIRNHVSLENLHYSRIIGIPLPDIFSLFEVHLDTQFSETERQQVLKTKNDYYFQLGQSELKPIDGIQTVIDQACQLGWTIYIVSSSIQEKLAFSLKTVGLHDAFDGIFCGKPGKAKNYREVLQKIQMSNQEVVVIEDSPAGILSAQQAEIKTIIAITTNFSKAQLKEYSPAQIIKHYQELELNLLGQ